VEEVLPEFFKGARQRAIAKFGKEAEDIIYLKFYKDGGAAAEIIDHFGVEGLNALKQVNNIQDAASELIKGKTAYRYIDSDVSYLNDLKQTGRIPSNADKTYFTLDKFENSSVAMSKAQLPKSNNAKWRLEFNADQIVNNVELPYAKYQNAEYIEVLARSYPKLGEGGATQFLTTSEIRITKMTNIETGEIIIFK